MALSMFSRTASKSKLHDVPLYLKCKYGGCQTGNGFATDSGIGRKDNH